VTDSTSPDFIPGLEGVRARMAAMRKHADVVAEQLRRPDSLRVNRMRRDGLRHIGGLTGSTFPPEQPTIDALLRLGLVKLADPDAAPVCGRYQVTELGTEVLGLIGGRG